MDSNSQETQNQSLSIFRGELLSSTPEESDFHNYLQSLSSSELEVLLTQNQKPSSITKGVLFENIFLNLKEREISNTRQAVLQSIFKQIFSSGYATTELQNKKNPDYVEVDEDGQIVDIFECKSGRKFLQRSKDQKDYALKTIKEIVQLTQTPDKAPTSIGRLINLLVSINEGPLSIKEDLKLTLVLPKDFKVESREQHLDEVGYNYQYLPVTAGELEKFVEIAKKYFK